MKIFIDDKMIQLSFTRQQTHEGPERREKKSSLEEGVQEKPKNMSQYEQFRVWEVALWFKCEV